MSSWTTFKAKLCLQASLFLKIFLILFRCQLFVRMSHHMNLLLVLSKILIGEISITMERLLAWFKIIRD